MANGASAQGPVVGRWYRDPLQRRFEVVGIDEEAGVIQVQYEDGEGGAIEVADWRHVMVDHDAPMDESLIPPSDDDRP